jgi:hypothetical protein
MEGFDIDTTETDIQRKYATYTNLDPGTYYFHVWASNNDKIWNPEGATVKIVIIPPWYKTLVARILFSVLAIALIVGFYHYRITRYKRQQKYLEKLVTRRTKEIQEQTKQLIRQKEKLEAHEIQLEDQKAELEAQKEELKQINDVLKERNTLLEERQQQIEEQAEELRVKR